jgi:hypothetical protein
MMTARVTFVLLIALLCTRWLGFEDHSVFLTIALGNVVSALGMAYFFARAHGALVSGSEG